MKKHLVYQLLICFALLSMAFYEADWKWAQGQCLHFLEHSDVNVRAMAVTSLGHIARIHRNLEREIVEKALSKHLNDEKISGIWSGDKSCKVLVKTKNGLRSFDYFFDQSMDFKYFYQVKILHDVQDDKNRYFARDSLVFFVFIPKSSIN